MDVLAELLLSGAFPPHDAWPLHVYGVLAADTDKLLYPGHVVRPHARVSPKINALGCDWDCRRCSGNSKCCTIPLSYQAGISYRCVARLHDYLLSRNILRGTPFESACPVVLWRFCCAHPIRVAPMRPFEFVENTMTGSKRNSYYWGASGFLLVVDQRKMRQEVEEEKCVVKTMTCARELCAKGE